MNGLKTVETRILRKSKIEISKILNGNENTDNKITFSNFSNEVAPVNDQY